MMNANDPNVVLLEIVAAHLGDALLEQMVFVGGAVAGLLITDPAMPAIRPTEDVDLVAQVTECGSIMRWKQHLKRKGLCKTCQPMRLFADGALARLRWM